MQDTSLKAVIQKGFDTVASGYDHPALAFFPQTASRMVDYLQLEPHQQLLDVCTGTGVVALQAAQHLPDGQVTGIDLSDGMLEQARRKAHAIALTNTRFMQMDLDSLEFSAESFDVVTSSFGLFFMDDMGRALSNMNRVLKKGGKLVISSFTGEAFSPFADLFARHYEETGRDVPRISWKRLAEEHLISEVFATAGIDRVDFHHEPLGYHMNSSDMWWDVVWNAGWRSLVNLLSEQELQAFKARHLAAVDELLGKEGAWFNTEVMIAIGHKES